MADMLLISDMVIAWAADCWFMWAEGEIFVENYLKIPGRLSCVSVDIEKLSRKHKDLFYSAVIQTFLGS